MTLKKYNSNSMRSEIKRNYLCLSPDKVGMSLNNFYEASIRITLYFFSVLIFWYFSIKGKVRVI
jgi:hypothetical protein